MSWNPMKSLGAVMLAGVLIGTCASIALASTPLPATSTGFDISWPQCASADPPSPGFGIVGVNDGAPFTANECLASQLRWAEGAANGSASFYLNTDNPGPAGTSRWPSTQTTPDVCKGANSVPCSYDYGWDAGRVAFAEAVSAESADGASAPTSAALKTSWWLDVETANDWEAKASSYGPSASSKSNDAATLEGLTAYLESIHVASVGVYSTVSMWRGITGGDVTALDSLPVWVPGSGSLAQAEANCATASFTGGRVAMTQYPSLGYDGDYVCGLLSTPTTVPVTVGDTATYSDQLIATNNDGAVSFVQASGAPDFLVSPTGLVTTSGQLAVGVYSVTGTTSDVGGDTGTFSLTVDVGTIFQASPTTASAKTTATASFSQPLNVTGNDGLVTYVQTSGAPQLLVSSGGLVTTSAALPAGTYVAAGTVNDAYGGQGNFTFTLSVGVIVQRSPTTATVASDASATSSFQLNVGANDGPVTFVQTSGAPSLVVSSSGLVTSGGSLATGTYVVKGTTTDAFGDEGVFGFTLEVTASVTTTTSPTTTTPPEPTARFVRGHAVTGATEVLTIIGHGFYGRPRITSHAGTSVVVLHDNGSAILARVRVRPGSRHGDFTFTIAFAHGQRCTVRYVQR